MQLSNPVLVIVPGVGAHHQDSLPEFHWGPLVLSSISPLTSAGLLLPMCRPPQPAKSSNPKGQSLLSLLPLPWPSLWPLPWAPYLLGMAAPPLTSSGAVAGSLVLLLFAAPCRLPSRLSVVTSGGRAFRLVAFLILLYPPQTQRSSHTPSNGQSAQFVGPRVAASKGIYPFLKLLSLNTCCHRSRSRALTSSLFLFSSMLLLVFLCFPV